MSGTNRLAAFIVALSVFGALVAAPTAPAAPGAAGWDGRGTVERHLAALDADGAYDAFVKRHGELVKFFQPGQSGKLAERATLGMVDRVNADPLSQLDEAFSVTRPLEAAAGKRDTSAIIAALAAANDYGEVDEPRGMPKAPGRRADVSDWLDYFESVLELANTHIDKAFAKLTEDNRRFIMIRGQTLLDVLRQTLYLQQVSNEQLRGQILGVMALSQQVDEAELAVAGRVVATLADPGMLKDFQGSLKRARTSDGDVAGVSGSILGSRETDLGTIVIGGPRDNEYDATEGKFALIADVGGDDEYAECASLRLVGENLTEAPLPGAISVVIDADGDDDYTAAQQPGLGGALGGVALLVDGGGDDEYTSKRMAMGFAVHGVGMLVDLDGDDDYDAEMFSQGFGANGIGLMFDARGDDEVTGTIYSTGVGLPMGVGCFLDRDGDDKVHTSGANASPPIDSTYGKQDGRYHGACQGFGIGFRFMPQQNGPRGGYAGGGLGICLDLEGDDVYKAGEFGQGCGYYFGAGIFANIEGDDKYESQRYGSATGAHQGQGVFIDMEGDDEYVGTSGVGFAGNWDTMICSFLDAEGDDKYTVRGGLALGTATIASFALFFDGEGKDEYSATGGNVIGDGGHASDKNYGAQSLGIFIDAGDDRDDYNRGGSGKERQDGESNVTEKKDGDTMLGRGIFVDEG
jgi:hypothetical protein